MKRKFKTTTPLVSKPGIYEISCSQTKKIYIGETLNLSKRIVKHFSRLRNNKHDNIILQNMFNKYGEETFSVKVLMYCEFDNLSKDEQICELHRLEKEFQEKCPNDKCCISMDKNEIAWNNTATLEQKQANLEQLNNIREKAVQACQKPIDIYNVKTEELIHLNSVTEAEQYIEQKHLYRNIRDKEYILYKNTYVAFLPGEFDVNKINISNSGTYTRFIQECKLYNLRTGKVLIFPNKCQFSQYFHESHDTSRYTRYTTRITADFLTAASIKSMEDFWNLDFEIRATARTITTCNMRVYYNALKSYKTNTKFAQDVGINRHTVAKLFLDKSVTDRLSEIDDIAGHLPNLFKNWKPSSQIEAINYEVCE